MAGKFSFVNSFEEIDAELAAATREITEVVVHWTGHYNDQNPTAEDIDVAHRNRYPDPFKEIGYHYVIHRDGSLQRGRDINTTGAHANAGGSALGRNTYTIGISFVGGINLTRAESRAIGGEDAQGNQNISVLAPYISSKSLGNLQFQTLDGFLDSFFYVFPYGQATGHNEVPNSSGKVDPGFDVGEYCRSKFGINRIVDPSTRGSLSRDELISLAASIGAS